MKTRNFTSARTASILVRGEVSDLSKDPLAANRALMDLKDAPSTGDPKAAVTLVEFSDFECPVCRSLHDIMRGIMQNYPQVRVVFKDYPIEVLHPWARTAAIAGRCAYMQDPAAFWKMYDMIYDNQDIISASNAWMKMSEYAGQIGLECGYVPGVHGGSGCRRGGRCEPRERTKIGCEFDANNFCERAANRRSRCAFDRAIHSVRAQ